MKEPSGRYRICVHCIMDTSDPEISFAPDGRCNHCRSYERLVRTEMPPPELRAAQLERLVDRIRRSGRGRPYDCLIGVSGGVDSTYVAYETKRLGLRPLAVHMDNGWNSSLAVTNIHKTLTKLGIDLVTEVLDWEEFRDLQLAFLRASTPDSEIPTDHAILAVMIQTARAHGIRHLIVGSNLATEAIMPGAWSRGMKDWKYIRSVHRRFGQRSLSSFPHFTLLGLLSSSVIARQRRVHLLNYLNYSKKSAMQVIERELDWVYYGGKHYESVYTRFYQAYILPRKFGIDKRRAHLSTLICNGELTRQEALHQLQEPICDPVMLEQDRHFVIKKLGISSEDFESIMSAPPRSFWDYPSYESGITFKLMRYVYRLPRMFRGLKRSPMEGASIGPSFGEQHP